MGSFTHKRIGICGICDEEMHEHFGTLQVLLTLVPELEN